MALVANPYASQDLFIASEVSDRMSDLVSRSDKDGSKPFSRQVDAWWFAMCIGIRQGQRTKLPDRTVKFNDGGILGKQSSEWVLVAAKREDFGGLLKLICGLRLLLCKSFSLLRHPL